MRSQLLFFIIAIILLSVVGIIVAQENTCEIQESDLATLSYTGEYSLFGCGRK
jgi:hypothetical protein